MDDIKSITKALECLCLTEITNVDKLPPTYRFRYFYGEKTVEFTIHRSNLTLKAAVPTLLDKIFELGRAQGEKDFKNRIKELFDVQ